MSLMQGAVVSDLEMHHTLYKAIVNFVVTRGGENSLLLYIYSGHGASDRISMDRYMIA